MDYDLKREKWIPHNCNDERMIQWCIDNLSHDSFDLVFGSTGFGCSCDAKDVGIYKIYPHDEGEWEEWMLELNENELRIYFCFECKNWAIDNDQ